MVASALRKNAAVALSGTSRDANADVLTNLASPLMTDLHTGTNFGASVCADPSTVLLTLNMVEHKELIHPSSGDSTLAPALASRCTPTACQASHGTRKSASATACPTTVLMATIGTALSALANATLRHVMMASTGKNHGASADKDLVIAVLTSTGTTGATIASACQMSLLMETKLGTKSTANGETYLRNANADNSGTTKESFACARRSHAQSDSTSTTTLMSVAAVASRVFAPPATSGTMRNAHVCSELTTAVPT